jgi:hypothetical protein
MEMLKNDRKGGRKVLINRTKYDTLISRFTRGEKVLTVFFFKTPSGNEAENGGMKFFKEE